MSEIDLDLLAALLGEEPRPELMQRYENDPEVRALYHDVVGLGESLDREGERRRDLVRDALSAGPAPGEERVREFVAERGGSAGSGSRTWLRPAVWVPLAAAAALLLLIRPWSQPGLQSDPQPNPGGVGQGPGDVATLNGGGDGLHFLDVPSVSPQYGELRWTPVEGDQVHYELWIWEADATGAALDELFPTLEVKDLAQTQWTPPNEAGLPKSILVQVHAFVSGQLWESSPSVWLRRD